MVESVSFVDLEDRMLSENTALHGGGERGSNNDSGKNSLVEIADDFFYRKGDGRDRCVESCGDSRGDSYREHPAVSLPGEAEYPREQTGDASADLHGGAFASQGSASADLECAYDEFTECIAKGDASGLQRVRVFHLRNSAADGAGHPKIQGDSDKQS